MYGKVYTDTYTPRGTDCDRASEYTFVFPSGKSNPKVLVGCPQETVLLSLFCQGGVM